MDPESEMHMDALSQGSIALSKYEKEEDIARHMKNFFDSKYSPNWHCIAGKNFANSCSCECKTYIFFYVGQTAILLYRLG